MRRIVERSTMSKVSIDYGSQKSLEEALMTFGVGFCKSVKL